MKRKNRQEDVDAAPDALNAGRAEIAAGAAQVSNAILDAGVAKLDALFGAGYARANPALLGQYLEATARTFQEDMASLAEMDDLDFDLPLDDLDRRR